MASLSLSQLGLQLQLLVVIIIIFSLSNINAASRPPLITLHYHNGTLLTGRITINLFWYGKFNPSQRAILSDFITSLSSSSPDQIINNQKQPSVSTWWWKSIDRYYHFAGAPTAPLSLELGRHPVLDQNYSLGKSLSQNQILHIADKANNNNNGRTRNAVVNVVLTADDVAVDGFCRSKCGNHGYSNSSTESENNRTITKKSAYIWIGNSEAQCPGYCAWPIYGATQKQSLTSPNNDMGLDGMVTNFAGLLASTVTNPFGNGYYHGDGEAEAPLEAASACPPGPGPGPGIYGRKNAYAAAGDLLVDPITGAIYNANGANGRRYLVPAIYDPIKSTCSSTLI